LLRHPVSVRTHMELAASDDLQYCARRFLGFQARVHPDATFRIELHVQQPCVSIALDVKPYHTERKTRLNDVLLHQDHAPEKQYSPLASSVRLRPGRNVVGVDDDRLGIACDIARQAQDFGFGWRALRGREAGRLGGRAVLGEKSVKGEAADHQDDGQPSCQPAER
jgi:hypothetical protein